MKRFLPMAIFILLGAFGFNLTAKPIHRKVSSVSANKTNQSVGDKNTTPACTANSIRWTAGPESMPGNLKAFQENKGQFLNLLNNWKILYGADYEGAKILFTDHGVIYTLPEKVANTDSADVDDGDLDKSTEEKNREKQKIKKIVYHNVGIEWENISSNLTVEAQDETPYYFGAIAPSKPLISIEHIRGYKKLIYHNVYPGIDVEYTFHEGTGIEYAITVHAGYSTAPVKLFYNCDKAISLDANGDVHIPTAVGDMIDHGPISFQNGNKVESSFTQLNNNEIAFKIGGTDPSMDLVIDPWTVSPTTGAFLPNDVQMDATNNTYIYGAGTDTYIQKYTAAGALSWTYTLTQYGAYSGYVSDLAVDQAGNSYNPGPYPYTNGAGGDYSMVSLTTGGTLNYFYKTCPYNSGSTPPNEIFEVWNVAYSCDFSELVQAGSPNVEEEDVGVVNSATGTVGGLTVNTTYGEIYAGCMAPNGNYYAIAANPCFGCSTPGDDIVCYTIAAGTATFSWNKQSLYQWNDFDSKNPDGIATNGIAAGCAYLYTSDGKSLDQRSLANGTSSKTVTIPGGANTDPAPSGIAVDMGCGYVYVGTPTSVQVYDDNLNTVTSVAMPKEVYDVCFNNGLVDATGGKAGSGFVTQFVAQTCTNELVITRTNTTCGNNNGTATVQTPTFCTAPYKYTWSNGQTTQTATGLAAGTYTVNVGTSTSCITVTDTVNIRPSTAVSVTATGTSGCTCSVSSTVTGGEGPYTYSWSSGQTTSSITGVPAGTYSITVTDAYGCVQTGSATVTAPTMTITPSQVNELCNGGSSGSITLTVTGGTPPYTYAWGGGQTTSSLTGLTIGTYTCTVMETGGCTGTTSVTITQPAAMVLTTTSAPSNCGASDGSAGVTSVTGGTGPYSYLWSSGQTTSTITNVLAGSYTVTVTDANSCTQTATIVVGSTGGTITPTVTQVNILCNGAATGSASVTTVTGGTAPYTYSWSNGKTTTTITGLTPGPYTIIVTDAGGCSGNATVTITQPAQLRDSIILVTNELCFGATTGGITAGVKGGTTAYTYSWNNGATTLNNLNIGAGSYTLTITDANNCTVTANATITQPTKLTVSAAAFPTSCHGECNGQLVSIPAGGAGGYTYLWSNAATTASVLNICPGTYSIVVTDANGCKADSTGLVVAQPTAVTGTTTTTTSHCSQADGGACVTASGGTPGYTYSWNAGSTTSCLTNVLPVSYTVIITDANSCKDTVTVTVPNVPGDSAAITASTNVTCNGGNDGTITGSGMNGTAPYTYLWAAGGQTTPTATNLTASTYTLTVTDATGCVATATATITQPPLVVATPPVAQTICIGQSATLTATAIGGTPGYTYTWNPGGLTGSSVTVSPITTTTYTITTQDSKLCPGAPVMVTVTVNPPLGVKISPDKATCPGGSVTLTATPSGGDGTYFYLWSPAAGLNCVTCQTVVATPTATTDYTVIVSDNCGTQPVRDSVFAIVDPLPVVAFKADTLQGCSPLCVNFTDLTTITSGGLFSWAWTFGDGGTSTMQNPKTYCYDNSGVFSVSLTVTSDSGCTSSLTIPNMITVYSHPKAAFTASPQPVTIVNPTINFTDESTDAYGIASWAWTFGDPADGTSSVENPSYTYKDTGTFCPTLVVTNIHGCTDTAQHCEIVSPFFTLYIPNAFSPNGDGLNDVFTAKGTYVCSFEMWIFDRWGMQLYYTQDINKGWDGTVNGGANVAQEDTYVYLIQVTDCVEHDKHQYLGKVSIVR